MTKAEKKMVNMAIGRLFSIMMRPEQEGDLEEYEKCKKVIMHFSDEIHEDYEQQVTENRGY